MPSQQFSINWILFSSLFPIFPSSKQISKLEKPPWCFEREERDSYFIFNIFKYFPYCAILNNFPCLNYFISMKKKKIFYTIFSDGIWFKCSFFSLLVFWDCQSFWWCYMNLKFIRQAGLLMFPLKESDISYNFNHIRVIP